MHVTAIEEDINLSKKKAELENGHLNCRQIERNVFL